MQVHYQYNLQQRVNGIFDELTEKSVKKIQQDYGFDINGIVGPLLWKKVVELSKR